MTNFNPRTLGGKKNNTAILGSIIFLIFAVICYFLSHFFSATAIKPNSLFELIKPQEISFAGERIPYDESHFFIQDRLEKEVEVLRWSEYQIVLHTLRAQMYFPLIEKELAAANIPDDFKYLAVAESSLKNDAVSPKAAAGIWQLMPDTARELGLTVNEYVDERYDVAKATEAAIAYFQKAYGKYKDWTLAAASYNRGMAGISNALTDQQVASFYDLSLNNETSRYVFRILAAKYCHIYREQFVSPSLLKTPYFIPKTKNIVASGKIDLKKWAKDHNITYIALKELNPWIVGETLPEGQWNILVLAP